MKITQDVRDYAAKIGVEEQTALEVGMKEKAEEFKRTGGEIYHKAGADSATASSLEFGAAPKD
jgi:phosphomethylpyrimidine synthase